jgi:hypothetical protein
VGFVKHGSTTTPAYGAAFGYYGYRVRYPDAPALFGDARFRFDDGHVGSFRVEEGSCAPLYECAMAAFSTDNLWIYVLDAGGAPVARVFVVAPYGVLDVLALDLVDGPEDELLMIMKAGHSSPPAGDDIAIFKLTGMSATALVENYRIAGTLSSMPIACARWRSRLFIDSSQPKPRSLIIRTELLMPPECRTEPSDVAEVRRRDGETLTYVGGHYVARR